MNPTASDLPELRPDPSVAQSHMLIGQRNRMFDLFEMYTSGLIEVPGKPSEHWALQVWPHGGEAIWVNLDATGMTIMDPAHYRQLTMHHLSLETLPVDLLVTMAELDTLRSLIPGWNGYDVAAPKTSSILRAKQWIREMYEDVTRIGAPWLAPHVAADEEGDVIFEWWSGDKGLTVYVSEQAVTYLKDWGPNIVTEMEDGLVTTAEERRELWAWLTS